MEFLSSILPETVVVEKEAEKVRRKLQIFKEGNQDEQVLFLADIDNSHPNSPLSVYVGSKRIAYEKLIGRMDTDLKPEVESGYPDMYEYFVDNRDASSIAHTKNIDAYLKTSNPLLPQALKVYAEIANLNRTRPGEKNALVKEVYCGYKMDELTGSEIEFVMAERWVARRRHEHEAPPKGTRIKPRSLGALLAEKKSIEDRRNG